MASYNRRNQDQQGRRVWPMPGMPINADTFNAGWGGFATGTNWTINSNLHNEMRFGIQHSGDTNEVGRQKEFFDLNGQVNGLSARFQLPLVSLLVADNAPVIGKHYITTFTDEHSDRQIAVIIPDLIEQHWYHYLLHNQQGEVLKALLLLRAQERVVVIGVPWYLKA